MSKTKELLPTSLIRELEKRRDDLGLSKTSTAKALGMARSAYYKKIDPETEDKFNEVQIEKYVKFLDLELLLYNR